MLRKIWYIYIYNYLSISISRWMLRKILYILLLYLFQNIDDSILMTFDSDIFLKSHISCNFMLKYYITILLRKFTKTLNQSLNLTRANKNLEICMPVLFEQNWMNHSHFDVLSLDNNLVNENYLKNTKSLYVENYCIWAYDFYMTVISNEIITRKILLCKLVRSQFFLHLKLRS